MASSALQIAPRFANETVGSRLDGSGGLAVGFDTLRVVLAICVVLNHQQLAMEGGTYPTSSPYWVISITLLPMFFALAGFLIAGSAERLPTGQFFVNRGLRIFPALVVETILSVIILGVLFTTLPLPAYFLHPQTLEYFGNIFGMVQFNLPGVFESNPHGGSNWTLWTIPYELTCYVIAALLVPMLRGRRRWLLPLAAFAWFHFSVALNELQLTETSMGRFLKDYIFTDQGDALFTCFLLGFGAYAFRHRIPYSRGAAAGITVLLLVLAATGWGRGSIEPLVWPAVTYLAVFIGASRLPRLPLLGRGDYSYGIYLYGVPVQQSVRAAFPSVESGVVLLVLVFAILIPLAMASWHFVESPMLRLRKRYSFIVRARGIARAEESQVGAPPPAVDPRTGKVISFGADAA